MPTTVKSPRVPPVTMSVSVGGEVVRFCGEPVIIPTGFAVAIPPGFELQIRPRSGIAVRHGVTVINSPGTIDADYRGEVRIGLINLGTEPFAISRGDRIAQMVLAPVARMRLEPAARLDATGRNAGGFGHTGR